MTLTKLRIIARRRWPLIALAVVLCLGAAYLVARVTDDDTTALPESTVPDSYLATGVVSVDRTQLYDQDVDLGLMVLQVEEAGLYEQANAALGLPGGEEALRESTVIFPGQIPDLDSTGEADEEEPANTGQPPQDDAVLVQVSNLDGDTAFLQADAIATTWATLASILDAQKLTERSEAIEEEIAAVEAELFAFDETHPRIAQLGGPEQAGDSSLIGQRLRLEARLDALTQELTQQAPFIGLAPPFVKLTTQGPQLVSELSGAGDGESSTLSDLAKWLLPLATGLALAFGLVWALEKMFPRVDTREDIQDVLGIPVLAEVPRVRKPSSGVHTLADLHGPDIEMYRSLRSSLEFIAQSNGDGEAVTNGNGHRRSDVIMIVSPTPSEGKTRSAALLGLTYAEAGHEVAIFGCDFRRPKLHDYFGVERDPGLGSLVTNGSVEIEDVVKRTDVEGLSVVPSGEPTNKTVPIGDAVSLLIDEARGSGVDVIIDTAPLLVANDAADLVEYADHVVLVVRAGKTHLNAAKEAIEVLRRHDAPIAGVVVIASHPADGGYYNYYRRYGYYEDPQDGGRSWRPWRRGGGGDGGSEPESADDPTS